ncbi:hypothetical protein [Xanthomonas cissicola]|nr:hypothetical protein [Xanthomonas cissicola]
MRNFWTVAPNHTVGRVLESLIAYGIEVSRSTGRPVASTRRP